MFNSTYRIKRQWNDISRYFSQRNDFHPFKYGKNMYIKVGDEKIKVVSKRDFMKKQEYIMDKYGPDVVPNLMFVINMAAIFDDVERKVGELLGTRVNKTEI